MVHIAPDNFELLKHKDVFKFKDSYNNAILKFKQKEKNKLISKELGIISSKLDCKIILLKGLVLAQELYFPCSERLFSDIDILVMHKDLDIIMKSLEYCGFQKCCEKVRHYKYCSDDLFKYIYSEQDMRLQINHIVYEKTINGIDLIVELHTSFAGARYQCVSYIDVFNRAIEVPSIAKGVYKLAPHDLLLYQMCHYCKHIGNYIFYNSEHLCIKERDIHEIAMLIKKYADNISWDLMIDRAIKWNMLGNINLCLSILNELYPSLLKKTLLEEVGRKTAAFSNRNSHNAVIDDISFLPAKKILNLDIKDTIYNGRICSNAPSYHFSHNLSNSDCIELNHKCFNAIINGFWDEEKLFFNTTFNFKDGFNPNNFDALMFTLGSNNCICGCQSFILEHGKRNCILKNEWSEPIKSDLIYFDINYTAEEANKLNLCITIHWSTLNVHPQPELILPFNMKIFIKNNSKKLELISLTPYKYFNFYNNSSIQLIN